MSQSQGVVNRRDGSNTARRCAGPSLSKMANNTGITKWVANKAQLMGVSVCSCLSWHAPKPIPDKATHPRFLSQVALQRCNVNFLTRFLG